MNQTAKCVKQATRGLWSRAWRELIADLESHTAGCHQKFRPAGLGEEEGERQTLREEGAPV